MLQNQAYAAYANNKVNTASPAELTLMLYEGAIKFCNIAIRAIEEGDIQKAHTNILKTERIIDIHSMGENYLNEHCAHMKAMIPRMERLLCQ